MTHPFLALLLAAIVASPAFASEVNEDACWLAYWDSAALKELQKCVCDAVAGDANAQFGYALILWSGQGRDSHRADALEWFRRAARQGHLLSRVALGRYLTIEEVSPVLQNKAEGYAWWLVAGESDSAAGLKQRMTSTEITEGERMAKEFLVDYGPNR
jgi:TPR repeat protein